MNSDEIEIPRALTDEIESMSGELDRAKERLDGLADGFLMSTGGNSYSTKEELHDDVSSSISEFRYGIDEVIDLLQALSARADDLTGVEEA